MSPEQAAKELQGRLAIPAGSLTVWAWHGDEGVRLIVRVDPQFPIEQIEVPSRFLGYEVEVERRQIVKAAARA